MDSGVHKVRDEAKLDILSRIRYVQFMLVAVILLLMFLFGVLQLIVTLVGFTILGTAIVLLGGSLYLLDNLHEKIKNN
jgi:hypothetical protein